MGDYHVILELVKNDFLKGGLLCELKYLFLIPYSSEYRPPKSEQIFLKSERGYIPTKKI